MYKNKFDKKQSDSYHLRWFSNASKTKQKTEYFKAKQQAINILFM